MPDRAEPGRPVPDRSASVDIVDDVDFTATADPRYGEPGAEAPAWGDVDRLLAEAELYWLATLRPQAGPHVTPLIGWWSGRSAYICTGADEQKARNLAADPHATLTTGCNRLDAGTDVVVEAVASPVTDHVELRRAADGLRAKHGDTWSFDVERGGFVHPHGGRAEVFRLDPTVVYAFGKAPATHTRYVPTARSRTDSDT